MAHHSQEGNVSFIVNDVQENVYLPRKWDFFLPFVSDGFISLAGSDVKVPVKILHDTAAFDSFINAST